ncbi:MAG: hypothetical protein HY717_05135 [Planctomycetes bacterium]|nr:hypothetical protein [Planctomycetota bacterium]
MTEKANGELKGTGREEAVPARFAPFLEDLLVAARAGWTPKYLLIAWLSLLPFFVLEALWQNYWTGEWLRAGGAGSWLLFLGLALLGGGWFLAGAGMVAAAAGWEYGRECRWSVAEAFGQVRRRFVTLLGSAFSIPLVLGILILPLFVGCLLLGRLPWGAGRILSVFLLATLGIPLGLMAAGFLVLGIPALLVMIPAATLDCRESFEAVSRSMSFFRARPLKFLAAAGIAAASSCAAAAATFLFLAGFLGFLALAYTLGTELGSLADFNQRLGGLLAALDPCWPLPLGGAAAARAESGMGWAAVLLWGSLGRLITASWTASFLAAMTRLYLYLRWELDQEPPSCLVRDEERFSWE